MTDIGHNSIASDELRLLVERVERVDEEIKALQADRKDVYGEAKSRGYDARTLREVVRLRKMDAQDRQARQALIELYCARLGLI